MQVRGEYMNKMSLSEKEQIEIDHWKNSTTENPGAFTKENFVNKTHGLLHFNYKIHKHRSIFLPKKKVLEIGAGQGWASCFLKRFVMASAHYTVTDISEYAISSVKYWENIFEARIEQKKACRSYQMPFADQSFDLIFCYSAAHHFVEHQKTLAELSRLLMPGGHIVYLHEPTSPVWIYPLTKWLVNKRPLVTPEDLLIPNDILKFANRNGLRCQVYYDPLRKSYLQLRIGIYLKLLETLPFLQRILPASADFVFTR